MTMSTMEFIRAQNAPVTRANQLDEERRRALWLNEDRQRDQASRSAEQAIRQGDERFAEDRRRFDEGTRRFDTRRSQFDGLMQMLFAGGAPAGPGGGMNSLRSMGVGGNGMPPAEGDGLDRRAINNALAAYLQGRM